MTEVRIPIKFNYYVVLMPQGLRQRWKLGLRFTFQEKGHTTVTLRGKYSCPVP